MAPKVMVLMGSDSDLPIVQNAISKLQSFGIKTEAHVASAHRSPEKVKDLAITAKSHGFAVIVAAAGMSAHLAGVVAAHTTLPVIGLPIKSMPQDGMGSLLSTVQMPPGIPVATVGIDAAENAAILAVQILAIADSNLSEKLSKMKNELAAKVEAKDREIQGKLEYTPVT